MVKPKWKDVTAYSRNDTDHEPRSWDLSFGEHHRLTVTRHINYPPDVWTAVCEPILYRKVLLNKEIEAAKREAIQLVRSRLEKMLADLPVVPPLSEKRSKS